MSDKEKVLVGIIIVILSAVMSYRITYVDSKLTIIKARIDKIIETK